ncbi:MAG: PRK06851 family protein [Clostridiales bacterium]|nr:PRK06851 family protein [Clostridiales bacterium]
MRKGQTRYVFPGSNTPKGFFSYYKEGLLGMEKIFILKGGPGVGKSTIMRKIGGALLERGHDVEFWQCSSDNDSLDGMLVPALGIAVIDGTAPHVVDPLCPGVTDEIINLGQHWDETVLNRHKEDIQRLLREIAQFFSAAYRILGQAGEVWETWQKINEEACPEQSWERLSEKVFCGDQRPVRRLFAAAITPKGVVSLADSITQNCRRRCLLQGPPSKNKVLLMQRLAETAVQKGHRLEIYHSCFQPQKIDLLLLPSLNTAVIDHAPPHEKLSLRPGDELLDTQPPLPDPNGRREKAEELSRLFHELLDKASSELLQAKHRHDDLESCYIKAMDFEAVDETQNRLFNKILRIYPHR